MEGRKGEEEEEEEEEKEEEREEERLHRGRRCSLQHDGNKEQME